MESKHANQTEAHHTALVFVPYNSMEFQYHDS